MAGKADSIKTIFFALGANFAIFLSKLVAAVLTGSGSMLAEAVHSLADCGNQGLLLLGLKRAKRPPSPDFPLGYGKAIYFWSFLVALLLFSVGGVFSVYEGLHKLQHPEPLKWPWLAVGVLGFGIIAEGFSMWGCLREVNKARGTQSLWRWFRDSRQSELIVIFGEDLAALLGLAFALVAVLLTMATGNPLFDALGSIVIGVLLVVVAVFVAKEVQDLLIGQSVDPDVRAAMQRFVEQQPEVKRVFNMITLQLGPEIMVAIKAEMNRFLSPKDMIDDINRVEERFKAQFPEVKWSFFEPDLRD
ncbi:MAG: cation diffusion facilitator family transporter [Lysobacterales bacterium]